MSKPTCKYAIHISVNGYMYKPYYSKNMMKKIISLFFLFLFYMIDINSQEFVHPGLLHSESSLDRIREFVRKESQPAYGSFNIMRGLPEGKADYCVKGPFETISRAGRFGYTKDPCERDFNAAYYNAILWVITGKQAHADKAMEIIRAYAGTLKKIEGPDDPLCAGLQGAMLVNAAEVMRYTYTADKYAAGWNAEDTQKAESMFRNVFQPVLTTFYKTKPYTNGNWGIAVTKAQMAFGIFMNDRKLYEDAVEFFMKGHDNGTLPNYVAESGQIQESGRDQQHAMLGLGCLSEIAEMAWTQGQDLYSALDNRLMKGYEYLAKSNLGYEVPFFTWKDITGKYSNWTTLGEEGMGRFRALFEIAYNHYVERKGLEMPYTKIVLDMIRPEGPGFTCDNPGFGSLLFYLGKDLNAGQKPGRIDEDLSRHEGWTFTGCSYKSVDNVMSFVSSGVSMQKKRISYQAGSYPYIAVKAPRIPASINKDWLQLSYSVASAPEFWKLDADKAQKVGEDIYVFKVTDALSNNGTRFTERPTNITLILNFGNAGNEPVVVEWVRSFEKIEDIAF